MWHLFLTICKCLFKIIFAYIFWINRYFHKIKDIPLSKRYGKLRNLVTVCGRRMGIKDTIVIGKENIPDTSSCYFANHLSITDPLLYFPIFEKPISFLGKIEIQKYPVAGKALTVGGGLFLDRENLKQQLKIMMKVQDSLKNNESNWMVFPEGTRRKDQMMLIQDFHPGTFRAPMKAKVPLVPVVNYGAFRLLSTKHSLKKYPTIVKFLKPIYPEEYENLSTEEVAKIIQSRIQKELTFSIREIDHNEMIKYNKKKYRFNRLY